MARITALEVARMLDDEGDWNDSDEEGPRCANEEDDDLVNYGDAEVSPLDHIERYQVFSRLLQVDKCFPSKNKLHCARNFFTSTDLFYAVQNYYYKTFRRHNSIICCF